MIVECQKVGGGYTSVTRMGGIISNAEKQSSVVSAAERVGKMMSSAEKQGRIFCTVWELKYERPVGYYLEISPKVVWILAGQTQNDVYSNTNWNIH